jgi:hypothetical protein
LHVPLVSSRKHGARSADEYRCFLFGRVLCLSLKSYLTMAKWCRMEFGHFLWNSE